MYRATTVNTKYGPVLRRLPYQEAALNCDGPCQKVVKHTYVNTVMHPAGHCLLREDMEDAGKPLPTHCWHDMYSCRVCGTVRIWG